MAFTRLSNQLFSATNHPTFIIYNSYIFIRKRRPKFKYPCNQSVSSSKHEVDFTQTYDSNAENEKYLFSMLLPCFHFAVMTALYPLHLSSFWFFIWERNNEAS